MSYWHAHAMSDELRRKRWEAKADWPLTFTAVVFLVAYAAPILKPDLVDPWPAVCQVITWAAWVLFVVDYTARLALSRDRAAFVRRNIFDLAVVSLPLLRPLRLLRLVVLLFCFEPRRERLAARTGGRLRRGVNIADPVRRIAGRP